MNKPSYISKLALYLQDKEPLIYLFLINSEFIDSPELKKADLLAGVTFKNGHVNFCYNSNRLEELNSNELYWLILHEAMHVFKKHQDRFQDIKKDPKTGDIINFAADAIINNELSSTVYPYGLIPKELNGVAHIPNDFKEEYKNLGKDAYTTDRLFNWILNRKTEKDNLITHGSYVKLKLDNVEAYGRIVHTETGNKDREIIVLTKNEMKKEVSSGKKINDEKKRRKSVSIDDLKHVSFSDYYNDEDIENIRIGDEHLSSEEETDDDIIDAKNFTDRIINQAKEIQSKIKSAGNITGDLLGTIEGILKPKYDWKKELRKNLNLFMLDKSSNKSKKKSIISYLWNPKSAYGILSKHFLQTNSNMQILIFIAIDTSGSIFYDKYELETFFTEMESVATWLEFYKKGKVFTIQWDTQIKEGLTIYKKGDWKKFTTGKRNVYGGGGTMPQCVFNYIDSVFESSNNHYLVKVNPGNLVFKTPNKKTLPFLILLSDGIFYNKLNADQLGIYKQSIKNILAFVRNENMIDKEIRRILYK